MNPEQAALLAAVRQSPDDHTPRLVYADWLEENPTNRRYTELPAYIRAECGLLAAPPDGPAWRAATFELAALSKRAGVNLGGWEFVPDLDRIRTKMDRLRAADPRRVVFGAARSGQFGHDYVVNRPVPEADLFGFERRHGFTLPAEYRAFLLRVGNGKMGPSYGLDPLDVSKDIESWQTPCPLTENLPTAPAEASPTDLREDFPDVDYDDLENGTLCLVQHGCGAESLLIVNGELRGQVWGTGDFSACELNGDGRPHDFLSWYEEWLDRWLAPGEIERRESRRR